MLEKWKENKALFMVVILLIILCIGMFVFVQVKPKEKEVSYNSVQYFETPDRIVYKIKGKDKYFAFVQGEEGYQKIVNALIHSIENLGQGKNLSKEEMETIEKEENYIELDYNTISKNYLIAYEKENCHVIKRTDNGGVVVRNKIQHVSELKEVLEEVSFTYHNQSYQMSDNRIYSFEEPISYEVPSWSNELKKYEQGIYSVRLGTPSALENFLERNNLSYEENVTTETLEKVNLIAMITKFKINHMDSRVGGVTCYFSGIENKEKYYITFLYLSKAINMNCIYRDYNNVSYTVEGRSTAITSEEENKDLTSKDTEIKPIEGKTISQEQAKQIAIQALKEDGITQWENIQINQTTENKYYLERWTDSNKDYANKYKPVTEYEAVETWKVSFQDAGDVGCYVGVWIDLHTGEVLCYHWTGE